MSTFFSLIGSNYKPELSSLRNSQLFDKTQTFRIVTKSKGVAVLAFQMVHQATQRNVLPPAARTVVDLLPMDRTSKMLIQRGQSTEVISAEIAAVSVVISSRIGGQRCRGGVIVVPADLIFGEDVIGVFRQYWSIFWRLMSEEQTPDSRWRQMPVRFVSMLEHHGHLAFLPTWIEDFKC